MKLVVGLVDQLAATAAEHLESAAMEMMIALLVRLAEGLVATEMGYLQASEPAVRAETVVVLVEVIDAQQGYFARQLKFEGRLVKLRSSAFPTHPRLPACS